MLEIIKKGQPQFKANLHSHSTLSDGKLSPAELKKVYKEHGYSVLAVTDHEYPADHSCLSDDTFLMLTGYEAHIRYETDRAHKAFQQEIHINLLAKDPHNISYVGYYEPFSSEFVTSPERRAELPKLGPHREREYTVSFINEFVRIAKENGYICTHNHPYWSMEDWSMIEQYEGFFSMEMCNYGSYVRNGIEYNAQLYENLLRKGKRLFCHSADDNHNAVPLDSTKCDSFGGFTMILSPELSYHAIFRALETGNFYSSMGPRIHELSIDGNHVHIETDPVRHIAMHYGGKFPKCARGTRDNPVCSADFTITPGTPFIRLTATDFDGRSADTRGIFMDEII